MRRVPSSVKGCDDDIGSGERTTEYGIRAGVSIFCHDGYVFLGDPGSEMHRYAGKGTPSPFNYISPKTVRTLVYRSRMSQNVRRVRDVSPHL